MIKIELWVYLSEIENTMWIYNLYLDLLYYFHLSRVSFAEDVVLGDWFLIGKIDSGIMRKRHLMPSFFVCWWSFEVSKVRLLYCIKGKGKPLWVPNIGQSTDEILTSTLTILYLSTEVVDILKLSISLVVIMTISGWEWLLPTL